MNGTHQLLVCAVILSHLVGWGQVMGEKNTAKENGEALLVASYVVGLKVNDEKSKVYIPVFTRECMTKSQWVQI